jgi:integrase
VAALYKRSGSPFWWVRTKNKDTGQWVGRSTGFRHTIAQESVKARQLEAELTARELDVKRTDPGEEWERWVPDFLSRHGKSPLTRLNYTSCWRWIYTFLRENGVRTPSELTYAHAVGFIRWRTSIKKRDGSFISKNKALTDIKVLRVIMRRAVRLGYATGNPCDRMGEDRPDPKVKPELTDEDIAQIYKALERWKPWMRVAFSIALYTGCRLMETSIDFRFIDFERKTITFDKPKGGREKAFTINLPTVLVPMLKAIKATGAKKTVELPANASQLFSNFFLKNGFRARDICFHCTRVTYVTRLLRSGVPKEVAMRLVNHASEIVHKLYQRHRVEDVKPYADRVQLPSLPKPALKATSSKTSRRSE